MPGSSHSAPPLACTVRSCGLLLERRGKVYACARGHAYDVARSGYINLLQPQDRRSLSAGDTADAVEARARLLAAGIGATLVNTMVRRAAAAVTEGAVVADLGSGSGELLAGLAAHVPVAGIGIDLSAAAGEYAARRHPGLTWVVANADRRLPLLDRTVDLVISMHGRRNPDECARVLAAGGHLLVAVPAPEDLVELRAAVQGRGVTRERIGAVIDEHAKHFEPIDRFEVRERRHVSRDAIRDLLLGTYRGGRRAAAQAVETLEELDVTLASTVVMFRTREAARG